MLGEWVRSIVGVVDLAASTTAVASTASQWCTSVRAARGVGASLRSFDISTIKGGRCKFDTSK